jgi:hypothetical protein
MSAMLEGGRWQEAIQQLHGSNELQAWDAASKQPLMLKP